VLELARKFPEVEFNIYGAESTDYTLPANMIVHGWVEQRVFTEQLRETPLFIRLTEHEGFPVSVIEAMATGCEVLMSMPYDPVFVSRTPEGDAVCFSKMIDRLKARAMRPNNDLIEIVERDFNKTNVIPKYYELLERIVRS
jgi:glycosyltransferase involved in cell wall biosynthesis